MARRGVQVGVVTNSLAANDVAAVHGGYMGYRVPLLEAGVHLYELKAQGQSGDAGVFGSSGASLHTKAFWSMTAAASSAHSTSIRARPT